MAATTTKTPNLLARLSEILGGDDPGAPNFLKGITDMVMGLGETLLASGVRIPAGGMAHDPATLGALSLDMKLPNVIAASEALSRNDEGRGV